MKKKILIGTMLVSALFAADPVSYVFSVGDVIKSSEINSNFQKLVDYISSLESKVTILETQVSNLQVSASATSTKELVGFTTNTYLGNAGVIAMNEACNIDYTGSTMCSSADILNSTTVISGTDSAWVKPNLATISGSSSYPIAADMSGVAQMSSSIGGLSCKGWSVVSSSASAVWGLSTNGNGSMSYSNCAIPIKVSCCK